MSRLTRALAAGLLAVVTAVPLSLGAAATPDPTPSPGTVRVLPPLVERRAEPATPAPTVRAGATAVAAPAWLVRLNQMRAQYGSGALSLDSGLAQSAQAWAQHLADTNAFEHGGLPESGYAAVGQNIAMAWPGSTNPQSAIEQWAAAPFHAAGQLNAVFRLVGVGSATTADGATITVLNLGATSWTVPPEIQVWPHGPETLTQYPGNEMPDPVAACPAPQGSYGLPIVARIGGAQTVTYDGATLYEDGVVMPTCLTRAADAGFGDELFVIPLRPLRPGSTYTGQVRAHYTDDNGATYTRTAPLDFYVPGERARFGDQNGDGRADLLAVGKDGKLYYYLTGAGPIFRGPFVTASDFGGLDWVAGTPDLDGDGHVDLVSRTQTGTLQTRFGLSAGRFRAPVQAGSGWGSVDHLTVLPTSTGAQVVGRIYDDSLSSYTMSSSGKLAFRRTIGRNWGAIARILTAGDMSGDGYPDLMGITTAGDLYLYTTNAAGDIVAQRKIGHGWSSMARAWSPGDLDLDGRRDLLAVSTTGDLWYYRNLGNGVWANGVQKGRGWLGMLLYA